MTSTLIIVAARQRHPSCSGPAPRCRQETLYPEDHSQRAFKVLYNFSALQIVVLFACPIADRQIIEDPLDGRSRKLALWQGGVMPLCKAGSGLSVHLQPQFLACERIAHQDMRSREVAVFLMRAM